MSRTDDDREAEWLLRWGRGMLHLLLVVAILAGGIWLVRKVSRNAGWNAIGEHYRQAEDVEP